MVAFRFFLFSPLTLFLGYRYLTCLEKAEEEDE
jgi:hypothetical protein